MKHVLAEYVQHPGSQRWDIGNIDNPTGETIRVVGIADSQEQADDWFKANGGTNRATFALAKLTPKLQAKARRAAVRYQEYYP